ncbi:Small RNA 2'-O-methyltransferase [Bulinus truncatus]|nr:Small RNA 2'-O-methyltransferase [Bulinus truncatus]
MQSATHWLWEIIKKHDIKSVIDFGCAECNFIKHLSSVPSLEAVALVDINRQLLITNKKNIAPELRHFIFKRNRPLHVSLMAGSAGDLDSRCLDYEAVTMTQIVFDIGIINLNGTGKNLKAGVKIFVTDMITQLNTTGVGLLSDPETHHLGHCTQVAIFCVNNSSYAHHNIQVDKVSHCYELRHSLLFGGLGGFLRMRKEYNLKDTLQLGRKFTARFRLTLVKGTLKSHRIVLLEKRF